ncbi:MAG: DUF1684 domain-containing protein [Caldilineaceae bacterium]|nr:DUF1684 domain-containing protein [Caldilineaceae bacterium]
MAEDETYETMLQEERQARAAAIAADDSWLTLAGLYWLRKGENSFGTATTNALVLPTGTAADHVGAFLFSGDTVTLQATSDALLRVNGEPITTRELRHDMAGGPDRVTLGALTMIVIKRGARYGIRFFDNNSTRRQAFRGLSWYPVDPAYRIAAQFVAYEPAKPVTYGNVLGDEVTEPSPGYVAFSCNGIECRLDALPRGEKLFFNFRDATNGDTTYGAGRFLSTDGPQEGVVIVDFNQATNPYCAYTDFATCPLPPAQNRLPVRIEAGEQKFTG